MMLLGLVLALVVVVISATDIPTPRFTHLSTGELELSVDDVPGLNFHGIKYSISGVKHQGLFQQAADGRWYHRNNEAVYNGDNNIRYDMSVERNGKVFVESGTMSPEESGLMLMTPPKSVRRGVVVFRDDFNGAFDPRNWNYEVSMYGGYNSEMQVYVPEATNIFTRDGHLFIKPTFTVNHPDFDESSLQSGTMDLNEMYGYCTNADRYGCYRQSPPTLPPIMSGKLSSKSTITYGQVEIRARASCGDWIKPGISMMPRDNMYGDWPRSGEIDIMELRGNKMAEFDGIDHGWNETGATLHWGTNTQDNQYPHTHNVRYGDWCGEMHTYRLEWTPHYIQVFVDDHNVLDVPIIQTFWQRGGFDGHNIWKHGAMSAPFDQPFFLILNVAVGGSFFPDIWNYNSPKPWKSGSENANEEFWDNRDDWFQSWNGDAVAMEIDFIEMTQY